MELRPLSEGNRLQRAYARWAATYYARMAPDLREQAELMDRFLYSRASLGMWLGLMGAIAGTSAGLHHAGMAAAPALVLALVVWGALPLSVLAAWLVPQRFSSRVMWRKLPAIVAMAMAGGATGFAIGQWGRHGSLDLHELAAALWRGAPLLVPSILAAAAGLSFLLWGVARVRQQMLERVLERERLARERDQAARQVAESRLHLLQAQIQPHFLFNTLATLQHWVDEGDARAGPLLRDLTGFLRQSTTLLSQPEVALAEEAEAARQYLRIQQARLGERLRFEVDIEAACAGQRLPAGILLTLVENAVEHGISPALHGGHVRVSARCAGSTLRLEVWDDGMGLADTAADGLGLTNCRERLRHRYGTAAALILQPLQRGTLARLTLAAP